jgi:hypothetical protein
MMMMMIELDVYLLFLIIMGVEALHQLFWLSVLEVSLELCFLLLLDD